MTAFGTLRCLGAGLLLFALCSLLVSKPMLDRQDCSTTAPSAASASSSKPIPSPRPAEAFHFEAFVGMPSSGLETPAVLPRAMKAPGCDLPLLCGWSLAQPVQDDAFLKVTVWKGLTQIRTSKASFQLFQQLPFNATLGIDGRSSVTLGTMDALRQHMNLLYENEKLVVDIPTLPTLNIPQKIHVIPMGSEPYFRRTLRDADMVSEGLWLAGSFPPRGAWLDFGGSHGRVTRALAAAFPQAEWHCSDPIFDSIEWGKGQVPNVHYHHAPQDPPMSSFSEGQLDGVYAISIWSHYNEESALAWFHEMHRIIKPGGLLWFSTHGFQTINYGTLESAVQKPHREEMLASLYLTGFFYFPMFGAKGDWQLSDGAQGTKWGFGAMTPEWVAARLLNAGRRWMLVYFGPGRNENNQDVYILRRN